MAMLRVHLMHNWFGYSDPAVEEALYEHTILRRYTGLSLEGVLTKPPTSASAACWRNTNWLPASWL